MESKIHLEEIKKEIQWILTFVWDLTPEERADWVNQLAQIELMLKELKGGAQ